MNILIVVNEENATANDASYLLQAYLESQNIHYCTVSSRNLPSTIAFDGENPLAASFFSQIPFGHNVDMAVVLGGDGTILSTARMLYGTLAPVLGINYGHLGFLANPNDAGVIPMVAEALAGDVVEQRRTNLHIQVVCEGDDEGPIEGPREFVALNDVAVARGASGRIVDFSFSVSGDHVAAMRGDGLVVSSATGSTGYALSSGGPLVAPGFRGLVVVPLAVHTLRSRPLVTEPSDIVEVSLTGERSRKDVSLFADGEVVWLPRPIERVIVRAGVHPTVFLKHHQESFFSQASRVFY